MFQRSILLWFLCMSSGTSNRMVSQRRLRMEVGQYLWLALWTRSRLCLLRPRRLLCGSCSPQALSTISTCTSVRYNWLSVVQNTEAHHILVVDFQPGEFLLVKEIHHNQHGLFLLEGQGIYRLGDKWFPVTAGDAIWMAPFVVQWYGALGNTRSRYIINKDTNRGASYSRLMQSLVHSLLFQILCSNQFFRRAISEI